MAEHTTIEVADPISSDVLLNQAQANAIVNRWMWWSLGAGLVPIPLADIAIATGIQIKMLKDIAQVYGVEWHQSRVKSVVGALLGSIIPTRLAHGKTAFALQFVPVVGSVAAVLTEPLFLGASTYAVGKVFTQHFASGGTFLDFKPAEVAAFFHKEFQAGKAALKGSKPAHAAV